nr:probable methyltransferase At1g27930 [Coffea arabica]
METTGNTKSHFSPDQKRRLLGEKAAVFLFGGTLFLAVYLGITGTSLFCNSRQQSGLSSQVQAFSTEGSYSAETMLQLNAAIVHYATYPQVPLLSRDEIQVAVDVLKAKSPCNFLIFGLGHDSLMWASLNPGGTTLFLEEEPKWVDKILKDAPHLRAHVIKYRTKVSEADDLLKEYPNQPECSAQKAFLRGNERCKLALNMLQEEVYNQDWDLILIDGPIGFFPEAPGRMSAIYSAAVMARNRKGSGATHVFVHNVDRKEEKTYTETFLCNKNRVKIVGKLGHFEIPPAADSNPHFC